MAAAAEAGARWGPLDTLAGVTLVSTLSPTGRHPAPGDGGHPPGAGALGTGLGHWAGALDWGTGLGHWAEKLGRGTGLGPCRGVDGEVAYPVSMGI